MGSSAVSFQTPTALYSSIADQSGYGSLFPASGLGWPGTTNTGPQSAMGAAWNDISQASGTNAGALGGQFGNALSSGQNVYNIGTNAANNLNWAGVNQQQQMGQYNNAASGVLNNLFNNQSGYYNQLYNQNQQQTEAANAQAGVAGTPYGAALTQQADSNFNNQWQSFLNQQQSTAANTAGTLAGTGINLGQSAAGLTGAATSNASQGLSGLLSGIGTASGLNEAQISDALNYINTQIGEGSAISNATNSATNAGAASTNSLANAQQAASSGKGGIGSALGGLGGALGKVIGGGL